MRLVLLIVTLVVVAQTVFCYVWARI